MSVGEQVIQMVGKIVKKDREYPFTFNIESFELEIHDYPAFFESLKNDNMPLFESKDILRGISHDNKYHHVSFAVRSVLNNKVNSIVIRVQFYVETYDEGKLFDSMSFSSPELNSFYDIKQAIEGSGFQMDGTTEIVIKKFDDTDIRHILGEDKEIDYIGFNFSRYINYGKPQPLTVYTDLQMMFNKQMDELQVYEHYEQIKRFFSFITYRHNIRFDEIKLKEKTEGGKYRDFGRLCVYVDEANFYNEEEKVVQQRMIKEPYIRDKFVELFELVRGQRLYMQHIPQNTADMRHVTPARFLMVTAAFEWEVQEVYGDYKYEENKKFREVTDTVYNILEVLKEKTTGKHKDYVKTYQKGFRYTGISLDEKIKYALEDNNDILEGFIKVLYGLNNIDKDQYKYNEMAKRLSQQRNSYAHGKIDRDMEELVILDFIIMEWLLYSMRLKQLGLEEITCKRIINDLFGRNVMIKDE